jgi:hypothetical protein
MSLATTIRRSTVQQALSSDVTKVTSLCRECAQCRMMLKGWLAARQFAQVSLIRVNALNTPAF